MPSTRSMSMPKVCDSSTVMTPSRPTLSMASEIISPISVSAAEMEATWAIWPLDSVSLAMPWMAPTAISTAASMPRFRDIGLAPAATLRRPSRTMAQASTVAVVVPSPATSSVFLATSLTSSAPMRSYGSSRSISLAMETPSLVIVGAPHFFSSTTLRPLGPSVTRTASASWFIPFSRDRRACSSNAISLDIDLLLLRWAGRFSGPVLVSTHTRRVLTVHRNRAFARKLMEPASDRGPGRLGKKGAQLLIRRLAPGDCGHHGYDRADGDGGPQAIKEADVLLADEHIDEAPKISAVIKKPFRKSRMSGIQRLQRIP